MPSSPEDIRGEGEAAMMWGFVRLGLFAGAFSIGMLLPHSGLRHPSVPAPVLNESAGASLVVACDNGSVVVDSLKLSHNAVQLHCEQSGMVVVRDHPRLKNRPPLTRTYFHVE